MLVDRGEEVGGVIVRCESTTSRGSVCSVGEKMADIVMGEGRMGWELVASSTRLSITIPGSIELEG